MATSKPIRSKIDYNTRYNNSSASRKYKDLWTFDIKCFNMHDLNLDLGFMAVSCKFLVSLACIGEIENLIEERKIFAPKDQFC